MTYAFDLFLAEFKYSPIWARMCATVEDSPWHREANVATHTEMVMRQYRDNFSALRSDAQNLIALTALLFHDTGKPAAEEVKEKKDGTGIYRSYAGHEQDSAVTFMEEYVRNKALRRLLSPQAARVVRWIIEHHLPYGLKDAGKRAALRTAMIKTLGDSEETFYDCLRSDCWGRISDDHPTKKQNVEDWIAEFKAVKTIERKDHQQDGQTMFIMIGPSGSGKSTWTRQHFDESKDTIISFDGMKLQFLVDKDAVRDSYQSEAEAYDHAWAFANENEKEFVAFAKQKAAELFAVTTATGGNVFIDIVNASKKKRAEWVTMANKHNYRIVAVEFWNTFETLSARQQTRGDKCVPDRSIKQQLYATTCAWLGNECDDVILVVGAS